MEFVRYVVACALGKVEGIPFSSQIAAQRLIFDRCEGLAVRRSAREGKLTVEVVYTTEDVPVNPADDVIEVTHRQVEGEDGSVE